MRKPAKIISPPQSLPDKKRFQSTLEALKSPPCTYLSPATAILGGVDIIRSKVSNNTYSSQYEFDTDIFLLANSANDGHFSLDLCSLSIFAFSLQAQAIASVSKAGLALSELYLFEDAQYIDSTNSTTVNVSSVANINEVDASEYFLAIAGLQEARIPIPGGTSCTLPMQCLQVEMHPRPVELSFSTMAFGQGWTLETQASLAGSSFNVSSGKDVYEAYCIPQPASADGSSSTIVAPPQETGLKAYPDPFLRIHIAWLKKCLVHSATELKSTSGHFSPTSTLPGYLVKKIRFMDLDLRAPSESATPPFKEEDILIVSDGICAATCTTFANLITNAGGVRALAFEVVHDKNRRRSWEVGRIFQNAIAEGIDILTPNELEHLNSSILQPLEQFPLTLSGNLKFCDAYQERNPDLPLQFEYPAADCRLFYTYENIRNPATTWLAAIQAI
ncbi:putative Tail specific protease domain-containing protein [Seiridium cardinale]|uniref:Tail specific protease domain-containing protein n=1 Tax=Seiridium cardinale TaxID=138064 RepID=A0ABR2X6F4_9PEZI